MFLHSYCFTFLRRLGYSTLSVCALESLVGENNTIDDEHARIYIYLLSKYKII